MRPHRPSVARPLGEDFLSAPRSTVLGDPRGNIYVSEMLRNEIWVLSPDGSQRILIANKMNAPLDTNTGLVLKGDVLCTSNSGFTHLVHSKPEEADRTVVCMKGFSVPK